MGRDENVIIFRDTQMQAKTNPVLSATVKASTAGQKIILEKDTVGEACHHYDEKAKVVVSKKRSFEAAAGYKGMKTCVHNFASSTTPGGGVTKGSSAQEECLCRCSTLYFSLNDSKMWDGFYTPHREMQNPLHDDDIIYTPGVYVIKTDTASPELMPEKDWYKVDVLTCAAPNLRQMPSNIMNPGDGNKKVKILDKDLFALHEKRLGRILDVAAAEGNEAVILGAFGCGAFENNPEVVAMAARKVIEKYLHSFKVIEFAIYCSKWDQANYDIFNRRLKDFQ